MIYINLINFHLKGKLENCKAKHCSFQLYKDLRIHCHAMSKHHLVLDPFVHMHGVANYSFFPPSIIELYETNIVAGIPSTK